MYSVDPFYAYCKALSMPIKNRRIESTLGISAEIMKNMAEMSSDSEYCSTLIYFILFRDHPFNFQIGGGYSVLFFWEKSASNILREL